MDAFELLKADHKKVAELFDQLEEASGKRKLPVFARIKGELELHTHIEETILYPALEKPEQTHDLTLEAYEEHNVVKTLLTELSRAKAANDEWQAKAKVLREIVEHHVDEEENELFDKAGEALNDEELEGLGDRMAAEKARKGQPVPRKSGAKEKTKKAAKPGIISRIADFVGLGSGPTKAARKPSKAPGRKKTTATKSSTKSRKPSRAAAVKRPSATTGSKRMSGSKSGSRKRSARSPGTKAKKRTARR